MSSSSPVCGYPGRCGRILPRPSGSVVRPIALTLPGQGDGNAGASLADQLAYLLAAIDASQHPVLVGHSAASTLVWMAASHRPARVRGVIMIGGFPAAGGEAYADFFPVHEGVMPFPGWEAFEHADVADSDEHDREELRAVMDPVPEGVATGEVTYKDEQRFSIPVGVVCPEFSTEDAKAWITGGDVPELARVQERDFSAARRFHQHPPLAAPQRDSCVQSFPGCFPPRRFARNVEELDQRREVV